jgi:hypothetical protein
MSSRPTNPPLMVLVAHSSRGFPGNDSVDIEAAQQMLLRRSLTGDRIYACGSSLPTETGIRILGLGFPAGTAFFDVPVGVPGGVILRPRFKTQRESRRHRKARCTTPRTLLGWESLRRLATRFRVVDH